MQHVLESWIHEIMSSIVFFVDFPNQINDIRMDQMVDNQRVYHNQLSH